MHCIFSGTQNTQANFYKTCLNQTGLMELITVYIFSTCILHKKLQFVIKRLKLHFICIIIKLFPFEKVLACVSGSLFISIKIRKLQYPQSTCYVSFSSMTEQCNLLVTYFCLEYECNHNVSVQIVHY